MPPENKTPPPFDPVDHLLPEHTQRPQSSVGPTAGIIIILIVLIVGAIYVWISAADRPNPNDNLPLIPGDVAENTQ